jgi:hypothetical protein
MKRAGEFASVAKRILCSGPNREFAIGPFGDAPRAVQAENVDVRDVIRLAQSLFAEAISSKRVFELRRVS